MMNWKEYQIKVAEIFDSIGAKTNIEFKVDGARGTHKIDVFVTIRKFGIETKWICECKYWKSPVPKEKVLTLYEITNDIGADKGFLFSESGFQSGAIRASKKTNIILTSLDELSDLIKEELNEFKLIQLIKEIQDLKAELKKSWIDDLFNLSPLNSIVLDEVVYIDGILMFMSLKMQEALNNVYPVIIHGVNFKTKKCQNTDELIKNVNELLRDIYSESKGIQKLIKQDFRKIEKLKISFYNSCLSLIRATEDQLKCDDEKFEGLTHLTLKKLKAVGRYSNKLKEYSRGTLKAEALKCMDVMIREIYPHMTKKTLDTKVWENHKTVALKSLETIVSIKQY